MRGRGRNELARVLLLIVATGIPDTRPQAVLCAFSWQCPYTTDPFSPQTDVGSASTSSTRPQALVAFWCLRKACCGQNPPCASFSPTMRLFKVEPMRLPVDHWCSHCAQLGIAVIETDVETDPKPSASAAQSTSTGVIQCTGTYLALLSSPELQYTVYFYQLDISDYTLFIQVLRLAP